MKSIEDLKLLYGSKVFRRDVMKSWLSEKTYQSFIKTVENKGNLDMSIAQEVAHAMMKWALCNSATHYAHWFIPMTDMTACKHEAFLTPAGLCEADLKFPINTLVKGESDASSFPSGGLRATFEARGYTTWDPTSPVFIKDKTLFIPSVFFSYNGEALDRKLPLLKSCSSLNTAGLRFYKHFGIEAESINFNVGAEQEYFLIERSLYEKRLDLRMCGRTLIGYKPPKGQQLDDHYLGQISKKALNYMEELETQLWELGIPAKTKHNEVAPAQHELAPVYETANIASDHNQITMEIMRTVAKQKNITCLLHEKPFNGVNGSGKHNNFSISTNTGINLLQPPSDTEKDGGRFILTLCAFLRSFDKYSDLIRLSAASPSNDLRLGGFEAPPCILSVFLGEYITNMLIKFSNSSSSLPKKKDIINLAPSIPDFSVDDSDRNRTSPMAFTGNKFEFRMLGSSQSLAFVNTVLSCAIAESLSYFADRLDKATDKEAEKIKLVEETIEKHGRIIYNGNNYSEEWIQQAQKRGLHAANNTVDCIEYLIDEKNISLFETLKVLSKDEITAIYEIQLENYSNVVMIEAETLVHMLRVEILPSILKYLGKISQSYASLKGLNLSNTSIEKLIETINKIYHTMSGKVDELSDMITKAKSITSSKEKALFMKNMRNMFDDIRKDSDMCESLMSKEDWPIPTYTELLYNH